MTFFTAFAFAQRSPQPKRLRVPAFLAATCKYQLHLIK